MKVFVKGLNSCAMRRGKIRQYIDFLRANGHQVVVRPEAAEAVILWTCAFREDMKQNSLSEIGRYQSCGSYKIFIAGCLPGIDISSAVLGPREILVPWDQDARILEAHFMTRAPLAHFTSFFAEENLCDDAQQHRHENPEADVMFHDEFIKLFISEGCRHRCSYCSELLVFPAFRSYPPAQIVGAYLELLRKKNSHKTVLLADSLGNYGSDIGTDLPELIRLLRRADPEIQIALNNLNPADFIRTFEGLSGLVREKVIAHINLPIQSASDRVLKLMNRGYRKSDLIKIHDFFLQADFKDFDTHVIIGFPTETQEDIDETAAFLLQVRPRYVLASGYMESPRAASAVLEPKVGEGAKSERLRAFAKKIREAGIICNENCGALIAERFERLNRI